MILDERLYVNSLTDHDGYASAEADVQPERRNGDKAMDRKSDLAVFHGWGGFFQHRPPFDPSDFVQFRKRVGEEGMEKVLSLTVRLHEGSEKEEEVMVDTTVQDKNITFQTDSKLAYKIINYCWDYAEMFGIQLRQSYRLS